jgi:hypothetical protein
MNKFDQILEGIRQELEEATTVTPVKPIAPTAPNQPRTKPNPFKRPGHNPFTKPKPKAAVDKGDKMIDFFKKRLNRLNSTFDKYNKK